MVVRAHYIRTEREYFDLSEREKWLLYNNAKSITDARLVTPRPRTFAISFEMPYRVGSHAVRRTPHIQETAKELDISIIEEKKKGM